MDTAQPATRDPSWTRQAAAPAPALEADTATELAKLTDEHGEPLRLADELAALAADLTQSLVAAGLVIHSCAGRDRTGGVCLTTSSRPLGVAISWTTHDALTPRAGYIRANHDVLEAMNGALADVVRALGWNVHAFGDAGAHLVTGHVPEDAATP